MVLADASPAEPADPHGGASTVPTIHPRAPLSPRSMLPRLVGRRLQGAPVERLSHDQVEPLAIETERPNGRPRDHARRPGNVAQQGDLAEVAAGALRPDDRPVTDDVDLAGSDREERVADRSLLDQGLARARPSPTIRARGASERSSVPSVENAGMSRSSAIVCKRSANVGASIASCEQPVERRLVDREELGILGRRGRSPSSVTTPSSASSPNESPSPASKDRRVPRVRMLLLDPQRARSARRRRRRDGPLAEDRARPGGQRPVGPAREIGQDVVGRARRTRGGRRSSRRPRRATRSRTGT